MEPFKKALRRQLRHGRASRTWLSMLMA